MSSFISAGFGSFVNSGKVTAVLSPDSAPIRRRIAKAREDGAVIDATYGRKIRSVLCLDNGQMMLCAIAADTITQRLNGEE